MSGPRRRDRSPRGSIPKPDKAKLQNAKIVEIYDHTKLDTHRPKEIKSPVQEARLLSKKVFAELFPDSDKQWDFPCGNRNCEWCEEQHVERLKLMETSDE